MGELLLSLVFGIHLLAVDCAMTGPLFAVWLQWLGRRAAKLGELDALPSAASDEFERLARGAVLGSFAAVSLGIVLGLAALVLVPHAEGAPYARAIGRLPGTRWGFVAAELVFYFAMLNAYWLLWRRRARRPWLHGALAVVAATDLIYHFPPLFAVVSTLSLRPALWDAALDRSLYWRLLLDGETLSRVVHHWLAAWAVGATAVMLLTLRGGQTGGHVDIEGSEREVAGARLVRRRAARIALIVTLVQLPIGIWVLQAASSSLSGELLGEDLVCTALFGASLVAALGLLHHLAMVAFGDERRGATWRAAGLMFATVLLMTSAFHRARQQAFEKIGTPATTAPAR